MDGLTLIGLEGGVGGHGATHIESPRHLFKKGGRGDWLFYLYFFFLDLKTPITKMGIYIYVVVVLSLYCFLGWYLCLRGNTSSTCFDDATARNTRPKQLSYRENKGQQKERDCNRNCCYHYHQLGYVLCMSLIFWALVLLFCFFFFDGNIVSAFPPFFGGKTFRLKEKEEIDVRTKIGMEWEAKVTWDFLPKTQPNQSFSAKI